MFHLPVRLVRSAAEGMEMQTVPMHIEDVTLLKTHVMREKDIATEMEAEVMKGVR